MNSVSRGPAACCTLYKSLKNCPLFNPYNNCASQELWYHFTEGETEALREKMVVLTGLEN